jgi:SecD/SecF fusion protein
MGIILDNQLISAPIIMSTISSRGQIAGSFTDDEVRHIVAVLNAGELPAPLQDEPVCAINIQGENTSTTGSP